MRALAFVFAALPIAFALIRAARTGYDFRYLWVALASLVGAAAVMKIGKAYSETRRAAIALSAGVFVMATLLAILAASLLGTRLGPGILVVACSFAFCFAISCLCHRLQRRQESRASMRRST
jgi:hypothetical protein